MACFRVDYQAAVTISFTIVPIYCSPSLNPLYTKIFMTLTTHSSSKNFIGALQMSLSSESAVNHSRTSRAVAGRLEHLQMGEGF